MIEDFFNRAGYWPIISSVTGALRIVFGFFVTLIGFKLLVGGIVGTTFCYLLPTKKLQKAAWRLAQEAERMAANGRLNVLRGGIEVIPLLGNAAVWLYDQGRKQAYLLPYQL